MLLKDRFNILIVDDSLEDRETYRLYLQRDRASCYDIQVACYAREGLQLCETTWPDAILLDFLLPDLNGIQFVESLQAQANERDLPAILVLTGQGSEEIAVTLMKQGVQDYALKNKLTERSLQLLVHRMLESTKSKEMLHLQQQWQQILAKVSLSIRRSLNLSSILQTAVDEIKKFLSTDRVVIYQFDADWMGTVVAEAVDSQWTAALGAQILDTCFQADRGKSYQQGRQVALDDVYQAGLSECHLKLLEQFQVKSNLIVPILISPDNIDDLPRLWGLLIAHQCQFVRNWTDSSVLFSDQIAVQLALAIQQAELLERLSQELGQRRQAEESLRLQTQVLERRNQDLDSFVAIASHDLRAPLRAIRNLATWISEDIPTEIAPSTQVQFGLLLSRAQQAEMLLDDLLQYAQLGRRKESLTTVLVPELLETLTLGIPMPPEFIIEFAPDLPTVVTNAIALEQVLTNLISNAVKHHHRPDGKVKITAVPQGSEYRFEIIDDGPGIDPEYHQAIFEVFRTCSRVKDADSTGVGLAIVKKLIELQGGTITLTSQLGSGTTFSFTWPLIPTEVNKQTFS